MIKKKIQNNWINLKDMKKENLALSKAQKY